MPIYLEAPAYQPGGPDGKGWNRLSIASCWTARPQCALRPQAPTTYWETLHRRAAIPWGSFYGSCVRAPRLGEPRPDCATCPVFQRKTRLRAFEPRILVRYFPEGRLVAHHARTAHLMNKPDDWDSSSRCWSWTDLLALDGWIYDGEHHHDGFSAGYWIRATQSPGHGGWYGQPTPATPRPGSETP